MLQKSGVPKGQNLQLILLTLTWVSGILAVLEDDPRCLPPLFLPAASAGEAQSLPNDYQLPRGRQQRQPPWIL